MPKAGCSSLKVQRPQTCRATAPRSPSSMRTRSPGKVPMRWGQAGSPSPHPSIADVHHGGGARGSLWVVNARAQRPLRSTARTIGSGAGTGAKLPGGRWRKGWAATSRLQRKCAATGSTSKLHSVSAPRANGRCRGGAFEATAKAGKAGNVGSSCTLPRGPQKCTQTGGAGSDLFRASADRDSG